MKKPYPASTSQMQWCFILALLLPAAIEFGMYADDEIPYHGDRITWLGRRLYMWIFGAIAYGLGRLAERGRWQVDDESKSEVK